MRSAQTDDQYRVVITGVGVASPLGNSLETYSQRLYAGEMGIGPIRALPRHGYKSTYAAQLLPLPEPTWASPKEKKNSSLVSAVTLFAAEQALTQSRLDLDALDKKRCGAIIGSGFHNLYDLEAVYHGYYGEGKKIPTLTIPKNMSSAPATWIGMRYGFKGVMSSVSSACSSGFSALRESVELIRSGRHTLCVTGGVDLMICESLLIAWERMLVTSRSDDPFYGCTPFDQDRTGIVLGDGAVMLVLESLAHAKGRGAPILAEIEAIFQNSDSVDLVKPHAAGEIDCMRMALEQAELTSQEIDLIFPHATGTRANDTVEYEALQAVFGADLAETPIAAIKSMIGHTMGASGPMSLAAALGSLEHGYLYPLPNLRQLEEGIEIDVATHGRLRDQIDNIMINTFAFGGINVCAIVSKYRHEEGKTG